MRPPLHEGDGVGLSASDLTRHVACAHQTQLDLAVALGERPPPPAGTDEALELVLTRGRAHEADHLARLKARGLSVLTVDEAQPLAQREAETLAGMREGVDVIYQATLVDGTWVGHADFLLRRELEPGEPDSALGRWAYDIADTKLARHLRVAALLQMAVYAERLTTLQGRPPRDLVVITGDGTQHPWPLEDVQAYARRRVAALEHDIATRPATEPVPVPACTTCRWAADCRAHWERTDDLSLVARLDTAQRGLLRAAGIDTVEALAASDAQTVAGVLGSRGAATRLVAQARLQHGERVSGVPAHELLAPEPGRGLQALPEPDEHDLYLDFEGDPFARDGAGLEYLAGLCDRQGRYEAIWAHDEQAEAEMVARLVERLLQHRRAHPGAHVYHYASYEVDRLKQLTGRHGVAEGGLDELLRGETFVDLYQVVRSGLRISKGSYGLKRLEAFYWGRARGEGAPRSSTAAADHPDPFGAVQPPGASGPAADPFSTGPAGPAGEPEAVNDAMSSVVMYERWVVSRGLRGDGTLDDGEAGVLEAIERYNLGDVLSTRDLHDWLEERRAELDRQQARAGRAPLTRPVAVAAEGTAEGDAQREERLLAERLDAAGHGLMAGLIGYHRRESRPAWWAVFHAMGLDDDALVDDPGCIGGLGAPEPAGKVARSVVWRYRFPPQSTSLRAGSVVRDVAPGEDGFPGPAGTLHAIDAAEGWLEITARTGAEPVRPRGLVGLDTAPDEPLRSALLATGEDLLAGRQTLGTRLLDRVVPAALAERPGTDIATGIATDTATDIATAAATAGQQAEAPADTMLRVGTLLDGEILAVQGPPGAGKTHTATRLVHALLDAGLRIGITASSHSALQHLLLKAAERDRGAPARALVKVSRVPKDLAEQHPHVRFLAQNPKVEQALAEGSARLVGGTPWLFARPGMESALDVLVVDEASQLGLANAVAAARSARSMVLLGDPQQLAQVTKGSHREGAGESVLRHLIGDHDVVPPGLGVFLDRTWRMHPQITEFVSTLAYDGRLGTAPGRERQRVLSGGPLQGAGLRWVPVPHEGCSLASPQEAAVVADLLDSLLRDGVFVDAEGRERALTGADVLVVAPYNAHVHEIDAALDARLGEGHGVQVGSVDRFQGREAPVVVYAMAASSAAQVRRGAGFLFDLRRLTVALSRAQALAVVVCSPALLDTPASSPADLRAVNALVRFADSAQPIHPPGRRGCS